jgi:hypothetical protein
MIQSESNLYAEDQQNNKGQRGPLKHKSIYAQQKEASV